LGQGVIKSLDWSGKKVKESLRFVVDETEDVLTQKNDDALGGLFIMPWQTPATSGNQEQQECPESTGLIMTSKADRAAHRREGPA